jgi:APA family basic amino acid/polyamine antiporter
MATDPPGPEAGGLRRSLRLSHATAMVVGTIIGASIFVQPSEITRQMPSVAGIIAAWIAAGLLTMAGALVCAELASAFPETGGVYVFLNESLSPAVGFLWGWAMLWSMHSGIIAAIAVVFARYVAVFVPMSDLALRLTAVGLILALTALNIAGVRHGGRLQTVFTAAKVAAIVVLVLAGWLGSTGTALPPATALAPVSVRGLVLAIAAGLFAYGGWHMVTYTAGETVDAARTIPRALLLGTAIVTICYAGLNAVYLRVLPLDVVRASTHVAADAAARLFGPPGAELVAGLVLISTFGAVNGIILVGPRVYYSMARDGVLFAALGAIHPTYRTPHVALLVQAAVASVLAVTNTYGALFSRVVYTEWIFFAAMAWGLMRLRGRPSYRPTYRVPAYPWVPVLFIAVSVVIVGTQVAAAPGASAIGLGLVLVGLPIYFLWSRHGRHRLS